ncbi:hypothetical protein C8J30_11071 [Rhodobacter viridis]|uniref:Type IV pilus biogenesis protein PilP n=1 Tax=Rhodobacter viridis TaxID=1054202 RepID=A0A318U1R6_9RHOB|nr:hypothetical protein [Rhodobacter viridis]PYF09198.1 hypothetical protein C8J30_11071 [Rhodobacter viridis]
MKPNFALNLSHDGIGLLHRGKSGWELVGEVALDAPDFGERLTALRRAAKSRAPEGVTSKIVVPASQILYTEVEAPGPQSAVRRKQIADALEGMTPYEVAELVFDWSGQGEVVQVAVVARETLAEAEAFADDCGFCPVSFVAAPDPAAFEGEPWFGITSMASAHLPQGARIERDEAALPVALLLGGAAPVEIAEAAPAEITQPAPELPPAVAQPLVPEAFAAPAPEPEPVAEALHEAPPAPLPELAAEEVAPIAAPAAAVIAPEPVLVEELQEVASPAEVAAPAEESLPPAPPAEELAAAPEAEVQPEAVPEEPADAPVPELAARENVDLLAALEDDRLSGFDAIAPMTIEMPETTAAAETARAGAAARKPLPGAARPGAPGKGRNGGQGGGPRQGGGQGQGAGQGGPRQGQPGQRPGQGGAGQGGQKPGQRKPLVAGAERPGVAGLGASEAQIEAPRAPQQPNPMLAAQDSDAMAAADKLRKMAEDSRRLAAMGTAALGATAGKVIAKAQDMRPKVEIPSRSPAPGQPEVVPSTARGKTVIGGRKADKIGGKPKYMGVSLLGGLVAFLAIAALWSSFLIEPDATTSASSTETASAPATPAPAAAPLVAMQDTPAMSLADAEAKAQAAQKPAAAPAPTTPEPQATVSTSQVTLPALPKLPPVEAKPATKPAAKPAAPQTPAAPGIAAAPAAPPAAAAPVANPTKNGTLTASGITLFEGAPPSKSKPRPTSVSRAAEKAAAAAAAAETPAVDPALKNARPKARPATVESAAAKAAATPAPAPAATPTTATPPANPDDGALLAPGLSPDLAAVLNRAQPKPRPGSVEKLAAAATAKAAEEKAAAEAKAAADAKLAADAKAAEAAGLASSRRPMSRPQSLQSSVQTALAAAIAAEPAPAVRVAAAPAPQPEPVAVAAPAKPVRTKPSPPPEPTVIASPDVETGEVESAPVAARGPTAASVAREATQKNALDLSKISLIGLYGTPSNRRALVRLPNGRFFKLQVGDRIDGGQVTAIGDSQMTYQKGGNPITLKLLKGG